MNWLLFFAPIIQELAKGLVKLIYDLVEQWASGLKEKPASEEKKQKAMSLAKLMGVELNDDQLDAAIEAVHAVTEVKERRRPAGKAAA